VAAAVRRLPIDVSPGLHNTLHSYW